MISLDKDENEIENENSFVEQEIVFVESESCQLSFFVVKLLLDIVKWGKMLGILLIIMGLLVILFILIIVIGVILGVLFIILGVFLMCLVKVVVEVEGNFVGSVGESMFENYGIFIKMQLFYVVFSIVIGLIGIILVIFVLVVIGIVVFESIDMYEDLDFYYYEDDLVFE